MSGQEDFNLLNDDGCLSTTAVWVEIDISSVKPSKA